MSFILTSDLIGIVNVSESRFAKTDYESIISTVEEKILNDLLGNDLYVKLMATPATAPYADLVNGAVYTVTNKDNVTVNVNYLGIKPMLKYFIHYEILKHQQSQNSEVGEVEPLQNNSQRVTKSNLSKLISDSYNNGIRLYGQNIEDGNNGNSFICGRRHLERYKHINFDYYAEVIKPNCFNYLYWCKVNHSDHFPTWQFTDKALMFNNGYL